MGLNNKYSIKERNIMRKIEQLKKTQRRAYISYIERDIKINALCRLIGK